MDDIDTVDKMYNYLSDKGLSLQDIKGIILKQLKNKTPKKSESVRSKKSNSKECTSCMAGDTRASKAFLSAASEPNIDAFLEKKYNYTMKGKSEMSCISKHLGPDELTSLHPDYDEYKIKKDEVRPKQKSNGHWLAGAAVISGVWVIWYLLFKPHGNG